MLSPLAEPARTDGGLPAGVKQHVLDDLADFLAQYVAFPSREAADATALWAAHTHIVHSFDSTPRLALLSPEKGSGKTRCLEVLELVCARARHAVNLSAAALFRIVAASVPTLLFDESDTFFGPKAKDHEELRGLINAGHRKGAEAFRCVGDPSKMEVKSFPAFCPVALAGIGDLPDTILDRAVLVRMRRRRADEPVTPYRQRHTGPAGAEIRKRLSLWTATIESRASELEPEMPAGLTDRPADVWEPLIVIADLAGGTWPSRARAAAVKLNAERAERDPSFGVRLLSDIRTAFGDSDRLATVTLLERLNSLEDAPWGDLRGKALDPRGLSGRLRKYEIRSRNIRMLEQVVKGYDRADFHDAWARYLPPQEKSATTATAATSQVSGPQLVAESLFVADEPSATRYGSATESEPLTRTVTDVAAVADFSPKERLRYLALGVVGACRDCNATTTTEDEDGPICRSCAGAGNPE